MKKLALLLLALPLAACATSQQTAGNNCDPRYPGYGTCRGGYVPTGLSHWQMTTAIYNGFNSVGSASASSGPISLYPAFSRH